MYCDPIQWKSVRDSVLEKGISRRGAARKFGLARDTVRKMLSDELPPSREKRARRRPVIGRHEPTIKRMVEEQLKSGYEYSTKIKDIFEYISNEENYCGSYSAVRDILLQFITVVRQLLATGRRQF
jgi:hypothetical protein